MECFKYLNKEEREAIDTLIVTASMLDYTYEELSDESGFSLIGNGQRLTLYIHEKTWKLSYITLKGRNFKQQRSRVPSTRIPLIEKINKML